VGLGLGDVWDSEDVGDNQTWRATIFAAIQEREEQVWKAEMAKLKNLRCYKASMKENLHKEDYLSIEAVQSRRAISRLRLGSSELAMVEGRRKRIKRQKRICRYCLERRDGK